MSALLQEWPDHYSVVSPDKQALTDGHTSISYRELFIRSNRIARCLASFGIGRGDHVAICMRRSPEFVVALVGALKAGTVYVPIQAESPVGRREKIFRDCQPSAIICDKATAQKICAEALSHKINPVLIAIDKDPTLALDAMFLQEGKSQPTLSSAEPLSYSSRDDDVACLHYTSGSTGDPKGVMISYRNIREYISWAVERIGIDKDDRILGTSPFHFDMSLFDIYCAQRVGASLCIADDKMLLFPQLLVNFAEVQNITIWKGVSSLIMYLARTNAIAHGRLRTLKKILFSGEVLPTKYVIQWMQLYPDKIFYNAYGPTEATGISMYYRVDCVPISADRPIPLGRPCENTEVLLLDEGRHAVGPGVPGEIYLRGVCVTKGYHNDHQKTAEVFFDSPRDPKPEERTYKTGDFARLMPDGNYEFLGRKDNQIKYMGYRIELSEIEQSIVATPGVRDAAVLLEMSRTSDLEELIAYVDIEENVSVEAIYVTLKAKLPLYMLPKQIFQIKQIPRSGSGKLDRQALRAFHLSKLVTT